MEEPKLENYGLTQKDVEYYLKQKELFDNEYKKHLLINEIISFFITWIISTVIVFVIMMLVDSSIFNEKECKEVFGFCNSNCNACSGSSKGLC